MSELIVTNELKDALISNFSDMSSRAISNGSWMLKTEETAGKYLGAIEGSISIGLWILVTSVNLLPA